MCTTPNDNNLHLYIMSSQAIGRKTQPGINYFLGGHSKDGGSCVCPRACWNCSSPLPPRLSEKSKNIFDQVHFSLLPLIQEFVCDKEFSSRNLMNAISI